MTFLAAQDGATADIGGRGVDGQLSANSFVSDGIFVSASITVGAGQSRDFRASDAPSRMTVRYLSEYRSLVPLDQLS